MLELSLISYCILNSITTKTEASALLTFKIFQVHGALLHGAYGHMHESFFAYPHAAMRPLTVVPQHMKIDCVHVKLDYSMRL